jgi:hypothetical protein
VFTCSHNSLKTNYKIYLRKDGVRKKTIIQKQRETRPSHSNLDNNKYSVNSKESAIMLREKIIAYIYITYNLYINMNKAQL